MRPLVLLALLAVVGCGESLQPVPGTPTAILLGRVERGLTVHAAIAEGGDTTTAAALDISVSPSSAAAVQSDGSILLEQTGTLNVTLALPAGGTVSGTFTIAAPPKILFDMIVSGNRDIYRASLDGNDLERLTTNPADDVHPTMAAGRVVFTSYRNGNGELYALSSTAGGPDQRLTTTTVDNTAPALSPDGHHLAYVRDDQNTPALWLASSDGSGAAVLTSGFGFGGSVQGSPSWSLHSDSLVFMATATGTASIYRVGASSGSTPTSVAVAAGDTAYVEPAWSPDGTRVVYVMGVGGTPSRLVLFNLAAHQSTMLTTGSVSVGQPAWLSDGRIVFTSFTNGIGALRWLDPSNPSALHSIALSGQDTERAAANAP